jgi:predicted phage terminase large subunit-like protein
VQGGRVFRDKWFKRYLFDPQRHTFDAVTISVDCTFKDTKASDYVVAQVWGRRGKEHYLLDQTRDRLTFTETLRMLLALRQKWQQARMILVEDKANGTAVIDTLRVAIPGVIPFDPGQASKVARAQLAAVDYEAGDVYHPLPHAAPWIVDYEAELTTFPGSVNDDQVDATSQYLLRNAATNVLDPRRSFAWLYDDVR